MPRATLPRFVVNVQIWASSPVPPILPEPSKAVGDS